MVSRKLTKPTSGNDPDLLLQRTLEVMRSGTGDRGARTLASKSGALPREERREAGRLWNKPSLVPEGVRSLIVDRVAHRKLADLILHDDVRDEIRDFLQEHGSAALLRSHSLEPRHKLLLLGPPGNGKTSVAEAIAFEAGLPFFTVRYDALMDSLLGETASRLRRLMDFAASCPCLLFFDEFDSVGKERGDVQDIGEVKRLVGSLLVQLDAMPSHTIVVCATNHPELLDRAVWRRFDLRLAINPPGRQQLVEWFRRLKLSLKATSQIDVQALAEHLAGQSFSEVEKLSLDVRRKLVISQGRLTADDALRNAVAKWCCRFEQDRVASADARPPDRPAPKRARRPSRKEGDPEAQVPKGLLV